jgi:CBS domain-containing protein
MICPTCGWDNLPGNEECSNCLQDLTPLDRPVAHNRVERSLMEDKVSVLKPRTPATVAPATHLGTAIQLMLTQDIGTLLVVDDTGKLLGIFSERDLLKKVVGLKENYVELPISDFMTPNPETVTAGDTLDFVLHKMDCGGYRHLPVVAEGKPAGVISVRDMLRHITRLCKE